MNSQTAAAVGTQGPKMLLIADKNQHLLELAQGRPQVSEDYKVSIVTQNELQDSNSKNKNRIKNNHYNLPNCKNGSEIIDNADINGKNISSNNYLIGISAKYSNGLLNEDIT
jgi:hypothetical protein